jgi:RimJ/RimL family protein N-acetyltransferase
MPWQYAPDARLEGSIVVLEPLTAKHVDGLWAAAQAPEIWQWTSHIADSRESFDSWFETAVSRTQAGEKGVFATLDRSTGSAVGSTSFHDFYPQDGVVEIGATWLNPSAWRSGANVEAKLLMMGHAFEALGCVRVEFKTDARNERSRAALASIPAQFEGILRRQKTLPGIGVRDSACYSVIDEEWPAVRENLRRRLAQRLKG